ncbi:MAG: hypothetical protein ACF8XB_02750 [Planctomycetota bacterium JB042]
MRCLIAAVDRSVCDTILAAVHAFEVECDSVDLEQARVHLRRRKYDLAFVVFTSPSQSPEADAASKLVDEVRELAPRLPIVGVARASRIASHRGDKKKYFALLGAPLDTLELYRTIRRALDRVRTPAGAARVVLPRS